MLRNKKSWISSSQTPAALRTPAIGATLGAVPIGDKPDERSRPHLHDEFHDLDQHENLPRLQVPHARGPDADNPPVLLDDRPIGIFSIESRPAMGVTYIAFSRSGSQSRSWRRAFQ